MSPEKPIGFERHAFAIQWLSVVYILLFVALTQYPTWGKTTVCLANALDDFTPYAKKWTGNTEPRCQPP